MSRPPEPEYLVQWRDWAKAGPPRCCHTCESYGVDGLCIAFFSTPPAEFAASKDACDQWEREIFL